uniref:Kisspeptin n=1 Tax=Takifugu niphobles TaxID=433688 RepID=E0D584_TAKNI|nr:kisspeptin precursor [Takifugu alboplumbeus]
MRVLVLLLVLAVAPDRGGAHATMQVTGGSGSVQLRRGTAGQLQLLQESNPCLTFRDNEDQLLCNRSKFNLNPFGLRFGKRFIYRRAMKQARTHTRSPVSQEVPT